LTQVDVCIDGGRGGSRHRATRLIEKGEKLKKDKWKCSLENSRALRRVLQDSPIPIPRKDDSLAGPGHAGDPPATSRFSPTSAACAILSNSG
jgi:hypothetical protein